jgi:hypothetical protein
MRNPKPEKDSAGQFRKPGSLWPGGHGLSLLLLDPRSRICWLKRLRWLGLGLVHLKDHHIAGCWYIPHP